MAEVYLDSEFKCYTENPDGMFRKVTLSETAMLFFANKCKTFIQGYRLKPAGETWVANDGKVFSGSEMITPWKPYEELAAAQAQYELDMAEAAAAYQEGVNAAYDQ